jgi:hypothetical protein
MEGNGKSISIGTLFTIVLSFYIAIVASIPEVISLATRKFASLHQLDFACILLLAEKCTLAIPLNTHSLFKFGPTYS